MPDTEDVSVLIDGTEFGAWEDVVIDLQLDSLSTIDFGAPFDSSRREMRDTFRPLSYRPLAAKVDGKDLFQGRLIGVLPFKDAGVSRVRVNGYALPGVLDDCPAPEDILPIEFKGLGLEAIANQLAKPFDLGVQFDADEGAKFPKAKIEVSGGNLAFLTDLAQQRDLVIGNTPAGKLLFQQSVAPGNPIARLTDDEQPVTSIAPTYGPQAYYSQITGFSETKRGRVGSRFTVQNTRLPGVLRPFNFLLKDTAPADVPAAVRAKVGRMFANAASVSVEVATWRDPQGDLWKPNTTLTLLAPDLMIYRESEFLIRGVTLRQNAAASTATLNLVLPGAFSGQVPPSLPWDEGLSPAQILAGL